MTPSVFIGGHSNRWNVRLTTDKASEKVCNYGAADYPNGSPFETQNSVEGYMRDLLALLVVALGVIMLGLEVQIVKLQQRVKKLEGEKK